MVQYGGPEAFGKGMEVFMPFFEQLFEQVRVQQSDANAIHEQTSLNQFSDVAAKKGFSNSGFRHSGDTAIRAGRRNANFAALAEKARNVIGSSVGSTEKMQDRIVGGISQTPVGGAQGATTTSSLLGAGGDFLNKYAIYRALPKDKPEPRQESREGLEGGWL